MELYEYFYPEEFRQTPVAVSPPSDIGWSNDAELVATNAYSLETFEVSTSSASPLFGNITTDEPIYSENYVHHNNNNNTKFAAENVEETRSRKNSTASTKRTASMVPSCDVCASPTANTLHFGGRSCKACAAFFRRTVSMSMAYECIGEPSQKYECKIHYELRMLCRHCRFLKCVAAGMKRELVQAKKEDTRVSKRKSRGLVRMESKPNEVTYDEYVNVYTNEPKNTITPKSEPEVDLYPISSVVSLSPPPSAPHPTDNSPVPQVYQQPCTSNTIYIDQNRPGTSSPYTTLAPSRGFADGQIFSLIDHYVRTESALNDRRRIMYTDTQIRDVFNGACDCPYERRHLKKFDYKTFCGFVKQDFIMLLDFVNQFPEFNRLMRNEKNVFYRMAVAVDAMISSAYYTSKIGINENLLVLFNADCIPMDPKPMSGEEPNAREHFENENDYMKYKTLMPVKIKQFYDMALPFARLGASFEEFVLLKALTIWHMSNYKLLDEGRAVCARQRDALVAALHRVVEDRGDEDPATRVGQLLLSMSYIMEQVQAMTTSYVMITFFDVLNCDSLLHDLCSFKDE